ncbi:cupin domain-containing protein [Temperatibacter marinus]|uniref:Cupin domain-containing protein n=1 Tax=Temperatibacter marinus TaxID=1456591 RepID=A0AA52EHW1_9PROT|nr:cupin domain-containing protein [Temperatibacter marinus]WND02809.1 cupin domain-containing protein [Temperatibacter marinus]
MIGIEEIARKLQMEPHPEGGFYKRTYCSDVKLEGGKRGTASAIYFILPSGLQSRWHTTDGDELWFWHAGSPLDLLVANAEGKASKTIKLGNDFMGNEVLQFTVPARHWQAARCAGQNANDWTLVSCVVSPEFQFEGFVMAEEGWTPSL